MSVPCRLRRWQFLGALAASALLAAAAPALAQTHLDNPFSGSPKWYVNPDYTANANNMAAQESDATEFIDRVRRDTGLAIEIVSQETEAKLAVSGCASLIDRNCDWTLVFDKRRPNAQRSAERK